MDIAITGATGFVGREVLRVCALRGHRPVPLTRCSSGLAGEIVTGPLEYARLEPNSLVGVGAVLHLAARAHLTRDPNPDPLQAYRLANVEGTRALLEAAIAAGVRRFVFMSSIKAVAEQSAPGRPLDEKTTPRPEDPYGISKLDAEQIVRKRCEESGIEWVIMRPPLVLGREASGNLKRLATVMRRGLPLPFGAIHNRRSVISVENLAETAVRACEAPGVANRILMPCDATLSTPRLLARIAGAEEAKVRLLPVPVPLLRLAGLLLRRGSDFDRLCGSLEIDPKSTFDALAWHPSDAQSPEH